MLRQASAALLLPWVPHREYAGLPLQMRSAFLRAEGEC